MTTTALGRIAYIAPRYIPHTGGVQTHVAQLARRAVAHGYQVETVGMALHLDTESALRGAKAYPEGSAQHEALWALILAAKAGQAPLEAGRYLENAAICAKLSLAAPVAEPTQTGIK